MSLDEDGNIVYNLGVLAETKDAFISLDLLLKSENNLRKENVSLFEYIPIYKEVENSYRYYEINDIPVLEVNSLCRIRPDDNTIEEFINDSSKFKDADKIIIDLRGNPGGSMQNLENWYKGFTGEKLHQDVVQVGLYTNTSIELSKNKFITKENEKEEIKDKCIEVISKYKNKDFFPGWSPIEYEDYKEVDNEVKIYILVDKKTASAAEFLAYYLKRLDNVFLVGTNTSGCTLTGNSNFASLPNSLIPLHISQKLYLSEDLIDIEGIGLTPDLWIKPDQALERLVKFINNNK